MDISELHEFCSIKYPTAVLRVRSNQFDDSEPTGYMITIQYSEGTTLRHSIERPLDGKLFDSDVEALARFKELVKADEWYS